MPLVKLTISDQPFNVADDEVDTLSAQGLLEHIVEPPKPPATIPPPAPAGKTTED